MGHRSHHGLPAILLFAMLGGALALLVWTGLRWWLERNAAARARRAEARRTAELLNAAREAPGGDPTRPIVVRSASVIESRAREIECASCGRNVFVRAHHAPNVEGESLRVVEVECRWCGQRRSVYFRISSEVLQ